MTEEEALHPKVFNPQLLQSHPLYQAHVFCFSEKGEELFYELVIGPGPFQPLLWAEAAYELWMELPMPRPIKIILEESICFILVDQTQVKVIPVL
ncbi:MAG: hypothetical protein K2X66_08860 [Cyanobacteria bacterium]|nr:hypothetical protein [Cyanobacteriota bacterium]